MKKLLSSLMLCALSITAFSQPIDRKALLERNNPVVNAFDKMNSLTVGNGEFAFTVDPTGLQTFPEFYSKGVPLGTMSTWAWHYDGSATYDFNKTLERFDFNRGRKENYSVQTNKEAADYFRSNPHRLHMGIVGFHNVKQSEITNIRQELRLETGEIISRFDLNGIPVEVRTVCHPDDSKVSVKVTSKKGKPLPIIVRMPYPTKGHSDDACDWTKGEKYHDLIMNQTNKKSVQMIHRFPDSRYSSEYDSDLTHNASYHLGIAANCQIQAKKVVSASSVIITPSSSNAEYTIEWAKDTTAVTKAEKHSKVSKLAAQFWHDYWYKGGVVDFSNCTDPRAKELERRVVLSQYLLAVNSSGSTPPQETGLTYNSWYGKFHLEMMLWHQAQFALWGHPEILHRTMTWFCSPSVLHNAKLIALRQGFKGSRWMKMTDPSGTESPSNVGSFLIWQEPHVIHLAELLRRSYASKRNNLQYRVVREFDEIVDASAQFMADFVSYDAEKSRYVLKGYIPAQETLSAESVLNSPFELSQWHYVMGVADKWRVLTGRKEEPKYKDIIEKLSPLASTKTVNASAPKGWEGKPLYLAAESATETFSDPKYTRDHMACLGALGVFPEWEGIDRNTMSNTLQWVQKNWNWDKTWGWDHPMTAMCAVRLNLPYLALETLLAPHRTNTYLLNGHNYQDDRLRVYLPGNGALLQCVALMCAGWDGCNEKNPGFPKDGKWNVRWEGISRLP